jgi:hypothetical protein
VAHLFQPHHLVVDLLALTRDGSIGAQAPIYVYELFPGIQSELGCKKTRDRSAGRDDLVARHSRGHLQSVLSDQQLTVVVDHNPCGLRSVVAVQPGFD